MIKIIDNFYQDIDSILDMAENSCHITGCGPGMRSDNINLLNKNLFNSFRDNIYNMFGLDRNKVYMNTHFTKNIFSGKENGLIHIDGRNPNYCETKSHEYKLILAGQIFITPSRDLNSGINFYDFSQSCQWDDEYKFHMSLNGCYEIEKSDLDDYHKNFVETVSVKNKQNRFVCWNGGTLHRFRITEQQQTRIVQNFYISLV